MFPFSPSLGTCIILVVSGVHESALRLISVVPTREVVSCYGSSSKIYTLSVLTVGILLLCTKVFLLPPALTWDERKSWVGERVPLPRWHWGAAELLARLTVQLAMIGSPCHRFWRIFGVACSRVAEKVVCPCLCLRSRSSSCRLVGRDRAAAKRMRTPLSEVCLQSAQVVVDQHADSPS
jgi:hypothetical protein